MIAILISRQICQFLQSQNLLVHFDEKNDGIYSISIAISVWLYPYVISISMLLGNHQKI